MSVSKFAGCKAKLPVSPPETVMCLFSTGKQLQFHCSFDVKRCLNSHAFLFIYIFWHLETPLGSSLIFSCILNNLMIRSDQSLSRVRLFATPWIAAYQASLSITNSRSSLRLTSIESVMPSSHLILCRALLLLPPIPPSIRAFSNESTLQKLQKHVTSLCQVHDNYLIKKSFIGRSISKFKKENPCKV